MELPATIVVFVLDMEHAQDIMYVAVQVDTMELPAKVIIATLSCSAIQQYAVVMELVVLQMSVHVIVDILERSVVHTHVMEQTRNQLLFVPLTVLALQKIIANVQLIGLALRVV
mgnify:CR=1 FL=1